MNLKLQDQKNDSVEFQQQKNIRTKRKVLKATFLKLIGLNKID